MSSIEGAILEEPKNTLVSGDNKEVMATKRRTIKKNHIRMKTIIIIL